MIEVPSIVVLGALLFTMQLNILNMWMCQSPEHPVSKGPTTLSSFPGVTEIIPKNRKFDPKNDCHVIEGTTSCAPRLFIIGTPKGGTTTLYRYLRMHPQIAAPVEKEMRFFDFQIRYPKYFGGVKEYIDRFPKIRPGENKMTFEATPWYIFMPATAKIIKQYVPNAKIVALLRNPIDRAWSHYHFDHMIGQGVNTTFNVVAEMEMSKLQGCKEKFDAYGFTEFVWSCFVFSYPKTNPYKNFVRNAHWHTIIANGVYSELLRSYYKYFQHEDIHVIQSEEFFEHAPRVMDRLMNFLGLEPHDYSFLEGRGPMNIRENEYEEMPLELRQKLIEFYKPYNDDLADLTGMDVSSWNQVPGKK
eukprot:TRINITY_DN7921_c0_g1_i1.p1 TRINITY_DN7921_c0_g1~~TRINITY_DN7921_c0_g1_i1.p1  ORF type:complete len:358 (-),score=62.68 TRINITY_DN7921_c0_g1_i1:553-1626(-)